MTDEKFDFFQIKGQFCKRSNFSDLPEEIHSEPVLQLSRSRKQRRLGEDECLSWHQDELAYDAFETNEI